MKNYQKTSAACLAAAASAVLVSCGGSGSDSTPTSTPTPTPTSITIAGTAVQGSALGGAAVTVKCNTGSATTTTAASGSYTVAIAGGALPCAVKVVGTNGTTYHSVVQGTGNSGSFVANVTPLTEMVVAHVSGAEPATYFTAFGSASTVPSASVAAAQSYVEAAMAGLASLTGINLLTDALVVGNAHDQKIDAIVAGIAGGGLTVATVTTSIVANPAAPSVVAAPLAPSATTCAWLKSGKYRVVNRNEADPKFRFESVQVDATALTATGADGIAAPLTSDGSCQFSINDPDATVKLLVSSGGILVGHIQSKTVATNRQLFVAVPEQKLPLAELAGTWNVASWEAINIGTAGSAVASNVEITIDSAGQITASKQCVGLSACAAGSAPFAKFAANPEGGFDVIEANVVIARPFLYKTLAGRKVAVFLDGEDSLIVAVPKQALVLPAVGTVTGFRSVQINGNNSVSLVTEDSNTITAIDSVAKTTTRLQASDNRVDTLTYDKPQDGLRYRVGNSCTTGGAPSPCAEVVQLPLPGMGITMTLSAAVQPSPQFYQLTVTKP